MPGRLFDKKDRNMMSHTEVSFQMAFVLKLFKHSLGKYGYSYPFIATFNKGKKLPMDVKADLLLEQKTYSVRNGCNIESNDLEEPAQFVPDTEDLYVSILLLKLNTKEDEKLTVKLFKSLARQYDPDAIAYINSCWYNEYENPDSVSDEEVLTNPDSVRAIHCCYYKREDNIARMCVLPFINKGKHKQEHPSFEETEEIGDPELRHDVLVCGCGWFTNYPKLGPFVKNPYRGVKRFLPGKGISLPQ